MPTKKLHCVFYGVMKDFQPYVRKHLSNFSVHMKDEPLSAQTIDPKTEILGVFVESNVTKKIISNLPKLKLIVTLSTGYDHIDLKAAKARKVFVCNVPSYGENTVAEHALALMLALSRKLFQSVKRVKEGVYDFNGLRGFDIKGKTIGIIGTGHIGIHFIRMLQGFDANIIAYDPYPNKFLQKKYNFTYTTLEKLFKTSHIISIHVPLLPTTKHLINKDTIKKMKKGVYIINTARGAIIDSEALAWGLETEQIGGAGLDVLDDENLIEHWEQVLEIKVGNKKRSVTLMNEMLIQHPYVIVTPHNAFNSTEAVTRIMDTTIKNINAFVDGKVENTVLICK